MTIDLAPSLIKTGLPLIEVFLSGQKHLFLLDSGASTNLVASSLKDSLPHEAAGAGMSYSFEGNVADLSIVRMTYSMDDVPHEANFTVTDDSTFSVFMVESGLVVEGIMGIPFLVEHQCVVDFRTGSLSLVG